MLAITYLNMGISFMHLNQNDSAEFYLEKSHLLKEKVFGKKHPGVGLTFSCLGDLYINKKEYMKALSFYQQALVAIVADFNNMDIYTNPNLDKFSSSVYLLDLLETKAIALEKLHIQ